MSSKQKIPVTIVSGFLGSGKTSFINQLLKKYTDKLFALVENEFGDVAIDTQLIKGIDASKMFELKQGCICCTISDEFELVLLELAERFPMVEHVLIETTGVADPAEVIKPFFKDERIQELYTFNGNICLVDANNTDNAPEKELRLKQIATADLVLVNKSENRHDLAYLKEFVQQINPVCDIQFVNYGNAENVDLNKILNQQKFLPDLNDKGTPHAHLMSKTYNYSRPFKKEDFLHWLTYTLDIYKRKVYRVKGIISFADEPFCYILQGVGGSFSLEEGGINMGDQSSTIVFIGELKDLELEFHTV